MSAPGTIVSEKFTWQPVVAGKPHDVPVKMFIADGALENDVEQTHVYLGMGEGRFASKAALTTLSDLGIQGVAVILPFHHLPCESANIERTLVEVPRAIAKHMNERAGRDGPVSIVGHSQSGGAALITAAAAPELFDNIAAWSPVGLTSAALGNTLPEKRHELLRRLVLENSKLRDQNPLHHPANIIAGAEIFSFILIDALKRRLNPKLDYALSIDGIKYIEKLVAAKRNVAVFGGETDPLFKTSEYLSVLGAVGLTDLFHEIPGSHSNPLVPAGQKQLQAIGNWLLASRATASGL